jgi:glycosyltransferase involved in cell wall biosynthesis
LNRSLSVILPVHNAQAWLSESVNEILEVLAELTDRFELIILDDGSTDGTWEIGRDLARRYPQIRPLREPVRCGGSLAIQPGLREAQGDVVMAHCGEAAIDTGEIVRLWRSLEPAVAPPAPKSIRAAAIAARRPTFSPTVSLRKISSQTARPGPNGGGFRLLRTGTAGDVRRTMATFQEAARRTRRLSVIGGTESTDGQARRPNFLSHSGSRAADHAMDG